MSLEEVPGPLPLTSASTTVFGRIVPAVTTVSAGVAAVMTWLSPPPGAGGPAVKWAVVGLAVVVSAVMFRWFGRFRHVWLEGEYLIVGEARRGIRIRLADVDEVEETRMQKLKWVKLHFAHRTLVGQTVRFIPRGARAWLVPWTSSPLVEELRERIEAAKGGPALPPSP